LVFSDQATGTGPPDLGQRTALRRMNIPRGSIKGPEGQFYPSNRMDPHGTHIVTAFDIAEFIKWSADTDTPPEEFERLVAANIFAVAGALTNRSWMQGFANAVDAIDNPHISAANYMERLAGLVVPVGVAQVTRYQDPYVKEVHSMLDAIKARTPGWSKDLPNVRDVWGKEIVSMGGFEALSPQQPVDSPIDEELFRLKKNVQKIPRRTVIQGAAVDFDNFPKAYDDLIRLAGNDLKLDAMDGLGAYDFLNSLVEGRARMSKIYEDANDEEKEGMIDAIRSGFNQAAKKEVLDLHPALQAFVWDEHARMQLEAEKGG